MSRPPLPLDRELSDLRACYLGLVSDGALWHMLAARHPAAYAERLLLSLESGYKTAAAEMPFGAGRAHTLAMLGSLVTLQRFHLRDATTGAAPDSDPGGTAASDTGPRPAESTAPRISFPC